MKNKPYPKIANTEFRLIPKSALNLNSSFDWPLEKMSEDLFHGYAITNKKEVWYGRGMPWHKLELSENHEGIKTITLRFYGQPGQTVVPIELLYNHVFETRENT